MSRLRSLSVPARTAAVVVVTTVTLALAAWISTGRQQQVADRGNALVESVLRIRTAMLDQETGVLGYVPAGDQSFLEPWDRGRRRFERDLATARRLADTPALRAAVDRQTAAARAWQQAARERIDQTRGRARDAAAARAHRQLMDGFRAHSASLEAAAFQRAQTVRQNARRRALKLLLAGLATVLAGSTWWIGGRVRRDRHRSAAYLALLEELQVAQDERRVALALERYAAAVLGRSRRPQVRLGDAAPGEPRELIAVVTAGRRLGHLTLESGPPLLPAERVSLTAAAAQAGAALAALHREADARRLASTDELTGLPNRRACLEQLLRLDALSRRTGQSYGLAVIDVDRFKHVNDTHGHEAGDQVLVELGRRLRAALRAGDLVGRWGGEELLILLPQEELSGAACAVERVREAVSATAMAATGEVLTVSAGVAVGPAIGGTDDVLRAADAALYDAKAAGRDRVRIAPVPERA